jgi:hypothetical protein
MQVAYYDFGLLNIRDCSNQETRVPIRPTESRHEVFRILAEVTRKYPDTHWEIVGDGPWGVHEKR